MSEGSGSPRAGVIVKTRPPLVQAWAGTEPLKLCAGSASPETSKKYSAWAKVQNFQNPELLQNSQSSLDKLKINKRSC